MEDLPYDLSMALKESSQAVEQTVRRHNRKRRGKKRRSNPNLDFDLVEVDFPNRSDASSGGGAGGGGEGGRRHGHSSIAAERGAGASTLAVPPSIGATFTGELAAAAAGAASAESSLAGIGAACLPVASADLSHGRPAGRAATSAASAARSDSDDVHIVARLSALTLPPSAAQLPARLAAAAAAAAAGVTATAKVQAGSAAPVAPGAAAAAAAASVVCGTASCGHSLVKDLESDSVNEKSPARPLNQRRRRRLRHMLVDDAAADVPGDGGSGAAGGTAPTRGGRPLAATALLLPPHGRSRPSDVGSLWSVGASGSGSLSVALPHSAPAVRQLWKRKRKQKMDTSDEPPVPHSATRRLGAAALPVGEHWVASAAEDDRMQAELLSSELSSTSSEDESTVGRWRGERGGGAAYDDAQEGDDEQSDFFHEPGPSYGVPPVAVAASWWGKENNERSSVASGGGYAATSGSSSMAAGDGFRGCSYFGYRTQSKDGGFLTSPAGDDRFSSHRHFSKLDRPFRIGRRRLKSASYRPHDESILYTAVAASSSRGACPLLVPSPLAQQLSQSSDVKRRRKAMLPPAAFDDSAGSSSAVSRSILIPHSSSTSAFSAGGNRANESLAHASL